ncbi:hypothetical protein C8F04DRAFT_1069609 [Mycena alexandri]|uniref:MYND-type domain-containing protein n=1 Tax=Mycena alexandri TaxID=1745969 RepID=A0AAD6XEB6_9AGAR|nr:hypothetical protein C8F04DRAFT_1069609 [Mycena alexandri]
MNIGAPKLRHRLIQCANCLRPESSMPQGEKFKTCGRCNIVRYCDARCQKKDWSKHKRRCESHDAQTSMAQEIDEIDAASAGPAVSLPSKAVYPLLHEWVLKYRPLLCMSLLRAQGLWDDPSPTNPVQTPPQASAFSQISWHWNALECAFPPEPNIFGRKSCSNLHETNGALHRKKLFFYLCGIRTWLDCL